MLFTKRTLKLLIPALTLLGACTADEDPQPQPQPQPNPQVLAPLVLEDIKVNTVLEDRNVDPNAPDYLVNSNIRVLAELNIKPGVVIAFDQDNRLDVNTDGKIIAVGTADKKIRFIGKSAMKGYWSGIIIYSNKTENTFTHSEILHAGSKAMLENTKMALALFDNARVSISNSTISESGGYGLFLRETGMLVNFANNVFSGNQEAPLTGSANHMAMLDEATVFTANNVRNSVEVRSSSITGTSEAVWPSFTDGTPYYFTGTIDARTGWKLKPGTTIVVAEDKFINIETGGYLNAVGTPAKKITITGLVKATGSWNGLVVYTRSAFNVLDYVSLEYAGGRNMLGATKAAISLFGTTPTSLVVQNSTISNSGGYGIHVFGKNGSLNTDVETSNTFTANVLAKVYYNF